MIIQIRPWENKFQIRVLNKPPRKIVGIIEYVERDEVEERVRALQQSYKERGLETVLDSWNPLSSSVYVIHLKEEVRGERKMIEENTQAFTTPRGYLYVGMTGLPIEQRVANHLRGYKSCRIVRKYFHEIYLERCERGLSYEEAVVRERALAVELRGEGYWVYQK